MSWCIACRSVEAESSGQAHLGRRGLQAQEHILLHQKLQQLQLAEQQEALRSSTSSSDTRMSVPKAAASPEAGGGGGGRRMAAAETGEQNRGSQGLSGEPVRV